MSLAGFIICTRGRAAMLEDDGCASETRFELTHALEWPNGAALKWSVIGGHPVMRTVQIVIRFAKWLPLFLRRRMRTRAGRHAAAHGDSIFALRPLGVLA